MKSFAALLFLAGALLGNSALAQEANYPSRPITIIVPFPPGGSPDLLSRVIGEKLSQRLGQPVLVENRPGASGTMGAGQTLRAGGDGYTLMMTPNTFVLSPLVLPKNVVNFDVQADFVPVILPAKTLLILAAHPKLGVKTVPELVAHAKQHPGLTYTGSGNGSPQHVAGEMLKQVAGIDMTFVPHRGLGPALNDTLAGHVDLMFVPYGMAAPHLKSGALIGLAGLDEDRVASAPGLLPMREQGYPKVVVGVWTGLFAPRDTPPAIVTKLNGEIDAILKLPDVKEKLEAASQILVGGGPDVLAKTVKADLDRFAPIVRQAKIVAD
jgi:tripartite-type tricarboxylate transporter receptor subunit TctC